MRVKIPKDKDLAKFVAPEPFFEITGRSEFEIRDTGDLSLMCKTIDGMCYRMKNNFTACVIRRKGKGMIVEGYYNAKEKILVVHILNGTEFIELKFPQVNTFSFGTIDDTEMDIAGDQIKFRGYPDDYVVVKMNEKGEVVIDDIV